MLFPFSGGNARVGEQSPVQHPRWKGLPWTRGTTDVPSWESPEIPVVGRGDVKGGLWKGRTGDTSGAGAEGKDISSQNGGLAKKDQ